MHSRQANNLRPKCLVVLRQLVDGLVVSVENILAVFFLYLIQRCSRKIQKGSLKLNQLIFIFVSLIQESCVILDSSK